MAQETVTEFKTVEEQKTRTLCDNCGRTDEEEQIIQVAINPREKLKVHRDVEIFETFDNHSEAVDALWKQERHEQKMKRANARYNKNYGLGYRTTEKDRRMKASAEADVCASCVFDLFNIEIPEDEEVEEIEVEKGELNINTTKEVKSIWPQVDIPEWTNEWEIFEPNYGWKGKIAFWPVIFPVITLDLIPPETVHGDVERTKGYVAASLGAVLWTAIILGIMWFTSMLVFAF